MKKHNLNTEIVLLGDVSLNGLYCDPQYYDQLKTSLTSFDERIGPDNIRIINWEAPITKSAIFNPLKNPAIATTLESAEVFRSSFRFDIATLGNNHIGDCMKEGFDTTHSFFDENKIQHLGAGSTKEEALQPIYFIQNSKRFCLLNFIGKETNPNIPEDIALVVNYIDEKVITQNVEKYSSTADFILVALHWGIEFVQYPSLQQKSLARKIIDSGASIVIGTHSHCLQGYENYNDGLIFYSLGNFIFSGLKGKEVHGWPKFCNRGGGYKVTIDLENQFSVEFIPFTVSNFGIEETFKNNTYAKQDQLSKNLKLSDSRYSLVYKINVIKNWFIRLPLFLIKTKGGLFQALKSYLNIKYFRLFLSYFKN